MRNFALALLVVTGCGVGGGDMAGDPNGVTCSTPLSVTGTFAIGQARPLDPDTNTPVEGCWPDGMWTFTVAVAASADPGACAKAPTPAPQYQFADHRTDPDGMGDLTVDNITYLTDPNAHWRIKISGDAEGCTGNVELFSADGKQVWNLDPQIPPTDQTVISGQGDYTEYDSDQWTPLQGM
jgi:hypothetical protein